MYASTKAGRFIKNPSWTVYKLKPPRRRGRFVFLQDGINSSSRQQNITERRTKRKVSNELFDCVRPSSSVKHVEGTQSNTNTVFLGNNVTINQSECRVHRSVFTLNTQQPHKHRQTVCSFSVTLCVCASVIYLYARMMRSAIASPIWLKTYLLSAQLMKNWFWEIKTETFLYPVQRS